MIITTAGRTNKEMIKLAKDYAKVLQVPYVTRNKLSIEEVMNQEKNDLFVVGKSRLEIYPLNHPHEGIFFHPNSAMFRVKRIMREEEDPLVHAANLKKGMTFLDCTLGLGSDSIVASSVVGATGRVVGIEGNRYLAFLLKHGLKSWNTEHEEINRAMRQIEVIYSNHLAFLTKQKSSSFDVVYFDPMFDTIIDESDGIKGLRSIALYTDIMEETIEEAKRVASKRILLKDHWQSPRFERFGFSVYRRKTAKFHYGVIEIN